MNCLQQKVNLTIRKEEKMNKNQMVNLVNSNRKFFYLSSKIYNSILHPKKINCTQKDAGFQSGFLLSKD